jgi:nucleoside-diphosphate-sugar epimerase
MANYLITGGTGFVGSVLVNALAKGGDDVTVLSRSPSQDEDHSEIVHVSHDIQDDIEIEPDFDVIIHAATPASANLNVLEPGYMFDLAIHGMKRVVEFARRHAKPPIVCLTSSGAVYGELPDSLKMFEENSRLAVRSFDVRSAYAEGKRAAEFLLAEAASRGVCIPRLARLFAFSGTLLPLDRHFAIGNFVRDAINQQVIEVRGDGKAVRSYLDQDDLAEWMFAVISRGSPRSVYHIGSERAISIAELAHLVATRFELTTSKNCSVEIKGQSSPLDGVSRYVPSTVMTRSELDVREQVSLEASIDKMIRAHLCD